MKKSILILLILTLMVPFIHAQAQESQKVYTLKMADSFPNSHPIYSVALRFMEEAKKRSNGRIQFEYYPAEQLGKLKDLMKLCQQGMTDITYVGIPYFQGQLGLNTVMEMPAYTTALEGSEIYRELLKSSPEIQEEWAKLKLRPFMPFVTNQYDAGTVKKQIKAPEDLKGLRLKSSGGFFELIAKRYGILPVSMPNNEAYEALQRGILDGVINSLPSVKGYRFDEHEKFHTLGMRLGGYPIAYVINEKSWNELPPDLQQALAEAGKSAASYFAEMWDAQVTEIAKDYEKRGIQITRILPRQRVLWDAPLKGVEEEWVSMFEKQGNSRKVYEQFKKIANEITKGR